MTNFTRQNKTIFSDRLSISGFWIPWADIKRLAILYQIFSLLSTIEEETSPPQNKIIKFARVSYKARIILILINFRLWMGFWRILQTHQISLFNLYKKFNFPNLKFFQKKKSKLYFFKNFLNFFRNFLILLKIYLIYFETFNLFRNFFIIIF